MFSLEHGYKGSDVSLKGIKLALVVDTADPLCLERIRVRVLGVHDMTNEEKDNSIWALHLAPSKSSSGEIPDVKDWVYVMFADEEDCHSAIWVGWARVGN
jgi:hypothetical protein